MECAKSRSLTFTFQCFNKKLAASKNVQTGPALQNGCSVTDTWNADLVLSVLTLDLVGFVAYMFCTTAV